MSDLIDHLSEIAQKIKSGRVVLFLGAGASASAGAPLEKQLVETIKQKFSKLDKSLNTLLEVCQDYLETPGYDVKDLEDFITQKLANLTPTKAHISLTKYDWPAIFTTNFDDLVETAYRNSHNLLKPCFTVSYPNKSPIVDNSKVYLFKLMGSISTGPEKRMVLCRSDYNKMITKRSEYLEHLEDYVKDGTIVFIGYKASDRLALDIIDEVIEEIGLQRLPWSYVLLKGEDLSQKEKYRFQSHKMIPIKCTFEDFFEELDKAVPKEELTSVARPHGVKIRIEGKDIVLSSREAQNLEEYFEILHEESILAKPKNRDDFFKGMINDYGYYTEGLDFPRETYYKAKMLNRKVTKPSLKDRVFAELGKRELAENNIILVKGSPGVGKSVMLRRLAYDVYSSGRAPVIFLDRTRIFFDYKLLSSTLVTLDRKFDELCNPKETHRLKTLLVIDDLATDPFLLKNYLTSRGRHVTIVIAGRENELSDLQISIPDADTYRVEEQLSTDEKAGIVNHLFKLGYVSSLEQDWDVMLDKEFENSFFATIYTLVLHARKPLNEVIRDQYTKLKPLAKKAFSYISAFHQFNLPINLEFLVRALRCSYEEFFDEVMPNAKGLIFEESDSGFLLYTSHHRIIARKTIEFFYGFSNLQKNLFLEVFSDVNLRNSKERELVQKLLIMHLSSSSQSTDLTRSDKIEIFKKVCSQHETKALLHHLGILMTNEGEYSESEETLKRSLATHERGRTPFRSELDQNILTSLGTLYSRLACTHIEKNPILARQEMSLATNCFLKARFGGFPNGHSYHAHANMYVHIGNLLKDDLSRTNTYATALEILQEAKDNLNEDQLLMIYELEVLIFSKIGEAGKSLEKAVEIADKFESARGYTLFANGIIEKSKKFKLWPDREPLLKRALSVVEEGLQKFPNDEYCLRLKAKIVKQLHPLDEKIHFASLQAWYNNARSPNVWLLFELAVTAFKLKQYEYSRQIFEKLENERTSGGLKQRYRELLYTGPYKKPLKFTGMIVSIENRYDGFIRCDSLPELHYPLHFRPIVCQFQPAEGDMVEFNIAFDFLGPRCVRVNRI